MNLNGLNLKLEIAKIFKQFCRFDNYYKKKLLVE